MDFDLADVLTVTSHILIPPADMDAVYRILDYLTGYDIYTHQIPEAMRVCLPWLLELHPDRMMRNGRRGLPTWIARLTGWLISASGSGTRWRSHLCRRIVCPAPLMIRSARWKRWSVRTG